MIAVVNNPDLKATRDQVGVAEAQAFAAGLLPNPQFSFAYGVLISGVGATTSSVSATLAEDIVPLLTRSVRRQAAVANERSVRLNLLWQEWQIVSQARTLFARAVELERQRTVIDEYRKLFADRYQRSNTAMQQGNETLPTVVSDLAALQAVETQLHDIEQLILKNRHDLNALLGLAPEVELRLVDRVSVPAIDTGKVEGHLARPGRPATGPSRPRGRLRSGGAEAAPSDYRAVPQAQHRTQLHQRHDTRFTRQARHSLLACRSSTATRAISRSSGLPANGCVTNTRRVWTPHTAPPIA